MTDNLTREEKKWRIATIAATVLTSPRGAGDEGDTLALLDAITDAVTMAFVLVEETERQMKLRWPSDSNPNR